MNFLTSLQENPIGAWVLSSDYGYYICLVGHAIGMSVVVGALLMVCIRVLGFSKEQPLLQFEPLFAVAWAGFLLNAVTGLALFMANGPNLVKNPPFLIKIAFIFGGGLYMWALWRRLETDRAVVLDANGPASIRAKILAVATMAFWVAAIMAGRLIAYTIDY